MHKKTSFLFFVSIIFLLQSCKKLTDAVNTISGNDLITLCDSVAKARIVAPKTTYVMGENIQLTHTSNIQNVFFNWSLRNVFGETTNSFNLSNCTKKNEGWYFMSASNPQCNKPKVDSVYIKVVPPTTAVPCTTSNNSMDFSGIATTQYASSTKSVGGSYGMLQLQSDYTTTGPTLVVYFHSFWTNKEPDDGVYTTNSVVSMTDQNDIYKVYVSFIQGAYFSAQLDQKVYVSHQNGKLKVTLCNVKASGNMGSVILYSYLTGSLIEK